MKLRGVIIDTYVQALQVVFMITVGFVLLNAVAGSLLEEHTLHDNIERRAEGSESESENDAAEDA